MDVEVSQRLPMHVSRRDIPLNLGTVWNQFRSNCDALHGLLQHDVNSHKNDLVVHHFSRLLSKILKDRVEIVLQNSKISSGLSTSSSLSAAEVLSGTAIWVPVIQKTLELVLLNVMAQMVDMVRRCEGYRIVISSCNLDPCQKFLQIL